MFPKLLSLLFDKAIGRDGKSVGDIERTLFAAHWNIEHFVGQGQQARIDPGHLIPDDQYCIASQAGCLAYFYGARILFQGQRLPAFIP